MRELRGREICPYKDFYVDLREDSPEFVLTKLNDDQEGNAARQTTKPGPEEGKSADKGDGERRGKGREGGKENKEGEAKREKIKKTGLSRRRGFLHNPKNK